MARWNILPATCISNSCIINIYDEGVCIPPHIDHHDFVRPFCTVSFMSVGPGEFREAVEILLPVGSILVLKGNGADVTKHCIPGVRHHRVFVIFLRMDDNKAPYGFQPDLELEELLPYKL
ncbi:uncharacterized protein LOC110027627 [Phalaenopsis equestris]|uniref:uncharacterized protein LOC110027627 n=1 Tax=Phalaenopsis equestris TaxID=78828 RepID=UPI0009E5BA07|nr:uncharacterized protein LOC110027627 [Phalaenopsis equestris]